MRVYKVVPMLVLFLLLTSGQSMQMIEEAYAACRPWPYPTWQGIVAGTVTVTNPNARITTDKLAKDGMFLDVEVSQEMLDAFKNEPDGSLIGTPVSGFIIVTGMKMVGFVPITRKHGKDETFKKIPAQKAIDDYNEVFEMIVISKGTPSKGTP